VWKPLQILRRFARKGKTGLAGIVYGMCSSTKWYEYRKLWSEHVDMMQVGWIGANNCRTSPWLRRFVGKVTKNNHPAKKRQGAMAADSEGMWLLASAVRISTGGGKLGQVGVVRTGEIRSYGKKISPECCGQPNPLGTLAGIVALARQLKPFDRSSPDPFALRPGM